MQKLWRKLDNTAKYFSLEDKKYNNIFRLSILLKEKVNPSILKKAILKTLENYPEYKVKICMGFFWHYLKSNTKSPIIKREKSTPCKISNFKKNNGYLFKVTYYNSKINLEINHVLTDGVGATEFLKKILSNYFDYKYNLNNDEKQEKNILNTQDEYLKNVDHKFMNRVRSKKAFLIKGKVKKFSNNTNHFILDLQEFKSICKKYKATVTEFLTALYIEALYKSVYDKNSKKDITIAVPIDLRKKFKKKSLSNFFINMYVDGNVKDNKKVSFNQILKQVHKEFKNKLCESTIKRNLANDVKLGTNKVISVVPLFIKKLYMKYMARTYNGNRTTTLSNIGVVNILEKYQKYIDNILVLVSPGKYQKVKCTVCSYDNKLNITLNSSLESSNLEEEFYKLLLRFNSRVKKISNI